MIPETLEYIDNQLLLIDQISLLCILFQLKQAHQAQDEIEEWRQRPFAGLKRLTEKD